MCPKAGPLGSRTPTPLPLEEAQHQLWALRLVARDASRSTQQTAIHICPGLRFEIERSDRHNKHTIERTATERYPGSQESPPKTKYEAHKPRRMIECLREGI